MFVTVVGGRTIGRRAVGNDWAARAVLRRFVAAARVVPNEDALLLYPYPNGGLRRCHKNPIMDNPLNVACGKRFLSQRTRNETTKRNSHKRSTKPSSPEQQAVTLQSRRESIDALLKRLHSVNNSNWTLEEMASILDETRDVFENLVSAVENRRLNPTGKHGKDISDLMERILRSYRQSCQLSLPHIEEEEISYFELCQEVLDALTLWNLNFHHFHYEHAIAVANMEGRWNDAASLFWKQVDPGAGFNPVSVSVCDPQGLIAIARLAQQEQSSVADLVFDAVLQLSMVSPQDQATYVLAAGNALGVAGEWESAVEFLNTSYTASQLGAPLVSSVMQTCLLSGKPEEALRVFDDKLGGMGSQSIAEEWQWGGDRDVLDPLARDLVMRAAYARVGASSLALELFRDCLNEGVTISYDALLGILRACERDRNMEGSLVVFDCILDNANSGDWIVPSSELVIEDREVYGSSGKSYGHLPSRWLPEMSEHLASVIRTCNSVSSFGTGLFHLRRADLAMEVSSLPATPRDLAQRTPMVQSLVQTFSKMKSEESLIVPVVVSLCGLRCYHDALELFDHLEREAHIPDSRQFSMMRKYVESEIERNGLTLIGNPWTSADRHINRLTGAIHAMRESGYKPTKREFNQLLSGLAAAMRSCTNSHHPDLSLRLLAYVANFADEQSPEHSMAVGYGDLPWSNLAMVNDALTAEIIHALGWANKTELAVDLFQFYLEQEKSRLSGWRLTCSAGLSLLVKLGSGDEALTIFHELGEDLLSADCYTEIGKHLLRTRDTTELGNFYNLALKSGNLSEELTLMTMAAVSKSKIDNRVRVLRAMVDDNAKYVGMARDKWLKTRYWHLKRALGFLHARLLMWWNDAETCHLDELDFAIAEFNSRKAEGLKVKNDVVRVIANNARLFNFSNVQEDFRWSQVPQTKERWTELLLKVIDECSTAAIFHNADFVDSVVAALRNLEANRECVAFVAEVLDRGVRVQKSTLSRALEAANVEQSIQLASDLRLLISEAQRS